MDGGRGCEPQRCHGREQHHLILMVSPGGRMARAAPMAESDGRQAPETRSEPEDGRRARGRLTLDIPDVEARNMVTHNVALNNTIDYVTRCPSDVTNNTSTNGFPASYLSTGNPPTSCHFVNNDDHKDNTPPAVVTP